MMNQPSKEPEIKDFARATVLYTSMAAVTPFFCGAMAGLYPLSIVMDRNRETMHRIASLWAKMVVKSNPWWKFEISGEENLPSSTTPVVFVANHMSQTDILAVFLTGKNFRWLAKDSLFKIPFLGWAMSMVGYVPVKRGDRRSHVECMQKSKEHLLKGTSMLFFPEGTRSPDGKLQEFKTGAFRLAKEAKVSVVPIAILGSEYMLPKGSSIPRAAKVSIQFLPAISSENLSIEELTSKSKSAISEALGRNS